jgi:hypothetical protein
VRENTFYKYVCREHALDFTKLKNFRKTNNTRGGELPYNIIIWYYPQKIITLRDNMPVGMGGRKNQKDYGIF